MSDDSQDDRKDSRPEQPTSRWEWAAAAAGLVLVLACAGYLLAYAAMHPGGAPHIVLEPIEVSEGSGGSQVRVRVRNEGYSTAAGVLIAGTVTAGNGGAEESEVTIDYLPQQSVREVTLVFPGFPAGPVALRVKGYSEP